MQCRLPRKNVPNKKSNLTWYLNGTISWPDASSYHAYFTCDGRYYNAIGFTNSANHSATLYIRYRPDKSTTWIKVAELNKKRDPPFSWNKEVYRTITFDIPPTGDLLTWLKANAVPQ